MAQQGRPKIYIGCILAAFAVSIYTGPFVLLATDPFVSPFIGTHYDDVWQTIAANFHIFACWAFPFLLTYSWLHKRKRMQQLREGERLAGNLLDQMR